jgi:hypothetical protein
MATRGKPAAAAPASAARRDSLDHWFPPDIGRIVQPYWRLDSSGLDQRAVLLELARHQLVELLGRGRRGIGADLGQPLLDLGQGERRRPAPC